MILFPPAKINLGLDIVSRREDGYHNLESVMYRTGWCDVLEIVPAKGIGTTLTVTGRPVNCPPEKNLVMKAYRALEREMPLPPVDIYLRKIIPDGAGLGGGSADAAYTLIGLNKLFSLGLPDERLAAIAATLGADCPIFIHTFPKESVAMFASGTGTTLRPVRPMLTGLSIAIVKPQESISTAEAYAGVRPRKPERSLLQSLEFPVERWQGLVKNDFEASLFPAHPAIEAVKAGLIREGALYASMSGSGSAVYGIFRGDILADRLHGVFPECDIFCGTLD